MSYGKTLRDALSHREMKQQDLAREARYSEQTVSAWCTDSRSIQADTLPIVSNYLDEPYLTMETWDKATDGVSIPVLDGDYIERNPASMKELVRFETLEALDNLERVKMIKPIAFQTDEEKEDMKRVIRELLDSACSSSIWLLSYVRRITFRCKTSLRRGESL